MPSASTLTGVIANRDFEMSQQEFETLDLETLVIQDQKPVLRVMLNRPKLANAMNLKMVNELMAVMEKVENENYRVLIISGGHGNFCAEIGRASCRERV